jgi:hypothetical protein
MTPTALHQAKQRTRRRRHEAGAVMFVVSMMVTVLAAVGMFALVSSATEVRTAGNERQNAQTHFLAQYGILAVAQVTEMGNGPVLRSRMQYSRDQCLALPIPAPTFFNGGVVSANAKACTRVKPSELQKIGQWNTAVPPVETYAGQTPYLASAANPGSLGPVPITADFFVELTEEGPGRTPAGYSGNNTWVTMAATSFGVTVPLLASGTSAFGAEGMEMQRARFNVGPVGGQ